MLQRIKLWEFQRLHLQAIEAVITIRDDHRIDTG